MGRYQGNCSRGQPAGLTPSPRPPFEVSLFFPPSAIPFKKKIFFLSSPLTLLEWRVRPLHEHRCTCFCSVFYSLHSLSLAVMSVPWAFVIGSALACTSSPRVSKMRAVGPGGPLIRGRRLRSPPGTSGEGRADSTSDQC